MIFRFYDLRTKTMDRMLGPTGAKLVGATFICLCLMLSLSYAQPSTVPDTLGKIRQFHSDFCSHQTKYNTGELKLPGGTVYLPWASRPSLELGHRGPDIMLFSKPTDEKIYPEGEDVAVPISDLRAMNGAKQREIVYDEAQNKDCRSRSLINSLDVRVGGSGADKKILPKGSFDDDRLEAFVDKAVASALRKGRVNDGEAGGFPGSREPGNYMDIDVSGVSVSAINTVEGGSAVATSNIIIKPVQIIFYPSEVEERLK